MRTVLDNDRAELDEHARNFADKVTQHGWMRTTVVEDEEGPGFSYTTGFWKAVGFPEIIAFSLPVDTVHNIFWDMYRSLSEGMRYPVGVPVEGIIKNLPVMFLPMAEKSYADYVGWNSWFYCDEAFPCLQMVWPDRSGLFPWEPDFDPKIHAMQSDTTESNWSGRAN